MHSHAIHLYSFLFVGKKKAKKGLILKKIRLGFFDEYQGPSGPFCSAPTHAAVCSYLQQRFQPQQLVLQQTAVLSHVFEGELIQHLHVAAPPTIGGSEAGRQPLGLEAVVVLDSMVAPEVGDKNRKDGGDHWDYRWVRLASGWVVSEPGAA